VGSSGLKQNKFNAKYLIYIFFSYSGLMNVLHSAEETAHPINCFEGQHQSPPELMLRKEHTMSANRDGAVCVYMRGHLKYTQKHCGFHRK